MTNPPGLNPLKQIRLANHLTQKEVALSTNPPVTPQVILRAEQGLFSAPPPSLIDFLSHISPEPLSPLQLSQQYYTWVYALRSFNQESIPVRNARIYFQNWDKVQSQRVSWKEFRRQVLGLSVAGTAKLLVVQISLIQDLERTGRNAQQISDILLQWGIPLDAINYIPANVIKRNNLAELA